MSMNTLANACPCGIPTNYDACCGRYISGAANAPTAEALMRSRYSAYTLNDEAYLRKTWEPRACPSERIVHDEPTKWLGLDVRKHTQDGDRATVEFVARYKIGGKAHRLHELSRFVREDGRWLYVDGTFPGVK
jgi:SEC-C motif domain protein